MFQTKVSGSSEGSYWDEESQRGLMPGAGPPHRIRLVLAAFLNCLLCPAHGQPPHTDAFLLKHNGAAFAYGFLQPR